MQWFGEPWPSETARAPVCEDDTLRIPTPVGETCLWCDETIVDGDRGELMPVMRSLEGPAEVAYGHIECQFRQVMGGPAHLDGGHCRHCGGPEDPEDPDLGLSAREAALVVWEALAGPGGE
jgi:hypothetical protein